MAFEFDSNKNSYSTRRMSKYEEELVAKRLQLFSQLSTWRLNFSGQWEESAALIAPNFTNTFFYQNYNFPGAKKTQRQVDATGALALERFSAICDSLLTPRNMTWHQLAADDDYVMKDRASRLWFQEATRILFKQRYAPLANFASQNIQDWFSLGAFGNCGLFIDALDGRLYNNVRGLRYKSVPLGELYFIENHQGIIHGFIRAFRMTAMQAVEKWGKENLPDALATALRANSQNPFMFLHCVVPRGDEYDPDRLDALGHPWSSCYVSIEGKCLMQPEGGYRSFPLAPGRYVQGPNEVYGRGPAQMVLPALKTLNAQKTTFLKQGHRAADPVLLGFDDGVNFDLRPGAYNQGGVSADGKELIKVLPTGNIQINKEMMAEERGLINDAFLVTLFQILTESPTMTATEVIERTNEKGILLAPTVGRQQSERLGPMVDRELDVLSSLGLLPEQPPRLREAAGAYQVVYTSPLAKAQRAQEAAGFIRTVETAKEIVAITQDSSYLDPFEFDEAVRGIADIQVVPESWMASVDRIAEKRKARAQAMAKQEQIQSAPAQAAMMKAQAAMVKAGVQPQTAGASLT